MPPFHKLFARRVFCPWGLLGLVSFFLFSLFHYILSYSAACISFGSNLCTPWGGYAPVAPPPPRDYSDNEISALVFANDLLRRPRQRSVNPKIAFMFLTPGPLPLERLWTKFFLPLLMWGNQELGQSGIFPPPDLPAYDELILQPQGHEDQYSVYIHASEYNSSDSSWTTEAFFGRKIRSQKILWGQINMVDAERRLLAAALADMDNEFFVLLSDTCVPLFDFQYVFDYLLQSPVSFVDCFDDPGPHGRGRYMDYMTPEIEISDWRKGAQWFAVSRVHALLIVADHVYYKKFKLFCKPGDENRNCYPDEHYVQTFLHLVDPSGLSSWPVTYVDWSEGKWHPKNFGTEDISLDLFRKIQGVKEYDHVTSGGDVRVLIPDLSAASTEEPSSLHC